MVALLAPANAFVPLAGSCRAPPRKQAQVLMSLSGGSVAVVGPSAGLSGLIAKRLTRDDGSFTRGKIITCGMDSRALSSSEAEVVVMSGDGEGGEDFLSEAMAALPRSAKCILYIHPASSLESKQSSEDTAADAGSFGSFLQNILPSSAPSALSAVRGLSAQGRAQCVVIHTGRLFGSCEGADPIPFVGGPLAEPVLDQSWTMRACVMGQGTLLAKTAGATSLRSSIADLVAAYLSSSDSAANAELSVVSVLGPEATPQQWASEMVRLQSNDVVSLLRVDVEAVPQPQALEAWLLDMWGPSMLREIASSRVRSGERPSRLAQSGGGIDIIWESVGNNLEIIVTGRLTVRWGDGCVQVERQSGSGQAMARPLIGEDEVIQSLIAALNSVAFTKGYLTRPRGSTSWEAAAAPARSTPPPQDVAENASASTSPQDAVGPKGRGRRTRRR
jgi:hypothetical protein